MSVAPTRIAAVAGSSIALMARVLNLGGNPPDGLLTQADVTSATLRIEDLEQGSSAPGEVELVVADIVFDTLQTALWEADEDGYNLRVILNGSLIPDPTTTYSIQIELLTTDGLPVIVPFEVNTFG